MFNVYILKNKSGKILYVGQSISLQNRLQCHMKTKIFEEVEVFELSCKEDMDCLEGYLIDKYSPPMNKDYPIFDARRGEELCNILKSSNLIPNQSEYDGVVRKVLRELSNDMDFLYYTDFTSKFTKFDDGTKVHEITVHEITKKNSDLQSHQQEIIVIMLTTLSRRNTRSFKMLSFAMKIISI